MASSDLSKLRVTEQMRSDLFVVASNADVLDKLLSASSHVGQRIGTGAVAKAIAPAVGMSVADTRDVLSPLLNIHSLQLDIKCSAAEVVELLLRSLRATRFTELADSWEKGASKITAALAKLVPDHPLAVASKAFRVATARQNYLVSMQLFSDIRPVFNEAGDAIHQAVVTHVLTFEYHDGSDHREIQFCLDASDVKELKEACARAERKGLVIKREMQQLPWPTTVLREPADSQE